jgi:hypothetical protein
MNAIRAIHPDRHEGFWVFDAGQRSAISGQLSAEARRAGRRLPGVLPNGPACSACGRSPMADSILVWMGDPAVSSVSRGIPPPLMRMSIPYFSPSPQRSARVWGAGERWR